MKAKDQIVIDELTTHTDTGRQELIHPYKTLYGRDLNSVLKDNLGDSWEEACATLMAEMRMYELECLRRRMEDEAAAMAAREAHEIAENNSMLSSIKSPTSVRSARSSGSKGSGSKSSKKKNGTAKMKIEDMLDECATEEETFSGHSCLLITWKTNPEVEKFKELYMDKEIKTHKRKNKTPVDPGDLVSEKSLNRVYKILGRVSSINMINSEECLIPDLPDYFDSIFRIVQKNIEGVSSVCELFMTRSWANILIFCLHRKKKTNYT